MERSNFEQATFSKEKRADLAVRRVEVGWFEAA
jgi:hypothetical protein